MVSRATTEREREREVKKLLNVARESAGLKFSAGLMLDAPLVRVSPFS
jgi:hypothetical protein